MYKEMWQKENVGEAPPKSSCCDTATVNESKGVKELSDVDFNLWTGKQRCNQLEHDIRC
jgi:hypothetical protein